MGQCFPAAHAGPKCRFRYVAQDPATLVWIRLTDPLRYKHRFRIVDSQNGIAEANAHRLRARRVKRLVAGVIQRPPTVPCLVKSRVPLLNVTSMRSAEPSPNT